jgi:hypothetical protein
LWRISDSHGECTVQKTTVTSTNTTIKNPDDSYEASLRGFKETKDEKDGPSK